MNQESWERLKQVYAAALELPTEERERYITENCKDEPEARDEALAMLRAAKSRTAILGESLVRINWAASDVVSVPAIRGDVIAGRFKIEELIGRGGMGEVYRAFDLELHRPVALKTIRPESFLSEQLRLRFKREAQLISKLSHAGICTLYDVVQHAGVDYLVMEFLGGETLAGRLSRSPLPLGQALAIARDVLSALEYAHRHGVIHRDIKPGNIMLTSTGAKLLDFGIAKLQYVADEAAQMPSDDSVTPAGVVLGTPGYIAPEQLLSGTDVRIDIYAVGVLLCSLLTGSRDSCLDPELASASVPPPFREVVRKCLAENPRDRWQDAGDLRAVLELVSHEPLEQDEYRTKIKRLKIVSGSLAAITLVSVVLASLLWKSVPTGRIEFQIVPSSDAQFSSIEQGGPAVISPDGTALAFVMRDRDGKERLWLRRLESASLVPLPGTDGASHPFWSPDSHEIGFFAHDKLMAVDPTRGNPRMICDAHQGRGAAWGRDGTIIFSPGYTSPLFRVQASGGLPVALTTLNSALQQNSHRWPSLLPDGKHVLFVARGIDRKESGLYVAPVDGGQAKRVGNIDSSAVYVGSGDGAPGRLLYVRGSQIVAQPFLLDRLEVTGEAVMVADLGWIDTTTTRTPVSISDTGTLVYGGGESSASQLVWYSPAGKEMERLNNAGMTRFLRLSPDEQTVAVERLDFRFGSGSLWLLGSERPTAARFTFDQISAYSPVWSSDSQNIVFAVNNKQDSFDLVLAKVDGSSTKTILSSPNQPALPTDWTQDGTILYETRNPGTGWDIHWLSSQEPTIDHVLLNSPADERQGRVSPNGEWLAYNSNEGGAEQVYIRPFAHSGQRIQISLNGGSQPVWSQNSSDLFFLDHDRTLVRSRVEFNLRRASPAAPLFRLPPPTETGLIEGWEYDIAGDDGRVLVGLPSAVHESKPITVIQRWKR
jgi:serine/threonine protein kinase